jgi:hypothetical protein
MEKDPTILLTTTTVKFIIRHYLRVTVNNNNIMNSCRPCDAAFAAAAVNTDTFVPTNFQLFENQDQSLDEKWVKMRTMCSLQEACTKSAHDNEYSNDVSVLYDVSSSTASDVSALYSASNAASDVSILYQQSGDSQSANQVSNMLLSPVAK